MRINESRRVLGGARDIPWLEWISQGWGGRGKRKVVVLLDPGDRSKYVAAHGPRRGEQTRLRGRVGRGIGHLRHGRTFRKHGPREAQGKEEGFSGLMRGTPRVPVSHLCVGGVVI